MKPSVTSSQSAVCVTHKTRYQGGISRGFPSDIKSKIQPKWSLPRSNVPYETKITEMDWITITRRRQSNDDDTLLGKRLQTYPFWGTRERENELHRADAVTERTIEEMRDSRLMKVFQKKKYTDDEGTVLSRTAGPVSSQQMGLTRRMRRVLS